MWLLIFWNDYLFENYDKWSFKDFLYYIRIKLVRNFKYKFMMIWSG